MKELLQEHKTASYEVVSQAFIESSTIKDLDMYKLAQFKGQVHAFDTVLELEDFMSERVEIKEEKQNDQEEHTFRK